MDWVIAILIIGTICSVVGGFAYWSYRVERQRVEALAAEAARLGLAFNEYKDYDLAKQLHFLERLRKGSKRYCYNVMQGTYGEQNVLACDYHYQTEHFNGKNRRVEHHYLNFTYVILPQMFPELEISPESIFDKIAAAIGFDDINFESAAFSKRYKVSSTDRKFAYDVCHPRMIERLMTHPDLLFEIDGNVLVTVRRGRLKPGDATRHLDDVLAFRELMPNYLFITS